MDQESYWLWLTLVGGAGRDGGGGSLFSKISKVDISTQVGRFGTIESYLTLLEEGLYQIGCIKDRLDRPLGRLVSL